MRELFASACVVLSMENRHLTVRALNAPIDDDSVLRMFGATEDLLSGKESFQTTWDIRECQIPSVSVTWKCIRWALKNKSDLDLYNTELNILCPLRLLGTVRLVLRVFGPKCPTFVKSTLDDSPSSPD